MIYEVRYRINGKSTLYTTTSHEHAREIALELASAGYVASVYRKN